MFTSEVLRVTTIGVDASFNLILKIELTCISCLHISHIINALSAWKMQGICINEWITTHFRVPVISSLLQ
jgi:hypothetical protein